jgi:hypothetical protein
MSTRSWVSGPRQLGGASPRRAGRDLGEDVADVGGRDRLHVVGVALDAVDADDRQQHVVAHAGAGLGGQQALGHRPQGLGSGAFEASTTASTPSRASSRPAPEATSTPLERGDDDRLVPGAPEGLDHVAADEPGPADHRDPHRHGYTRRRVR